MWGHLTQPERGFEDGSLPTKTARRVFVPLGRSSEGICFSPRQEEDALHILNSVLQLEQANPLGTPGGLIIIHFCAFPRVPFLPQCGCWLFNRRCSTGLRKT